MNQIGNIDDLIEERVTEAHEYDAAYKALRARRKEAVEAGKRIPLPAGGEEPIVLSLGRDRASNVRFPDQTMSRRQAELRARDARAGVPCSPK